MNQNSKTINDKEMIHCDRIVFEDDAVEEELFPDLPSSPRLAALATTAETDPAIPTFTRTDQIDNFDALYESKYAHNPELKLKILDIICRRKYYTIPLILSDIHSCGDSIEDGLLTAVIMKYLHRWGQHNVIAKVVKGTTEFLNIWYTCERNAAHYRQQLLIRLEKLKFKSVSTNTNSSLERTQDRKECDDLKVEDAKTEGTHKSHKVCDSSDSQSGSRSTLNVNAEPFMPRQPRQPRRLCVSGGAKINLVSVPVDEDENVTLKLNLKAKAGPLQSKPSRNSNLHRVKPILRASFVNSFDLQVMRVITAFFAPDKWFDAMLISNYINLKVYKLDTFLNIITALLRDHYRKGVVVMLPPHAQPECRANSKYRTRFQIHPIKFYQHLAVLQSRTEKPRLVQRLYRPTVYQQPRPRLMPHRMYMPQNGYFFPSVDQLNMWSKAKKNYGR